MTPLPKQRLIGVDVARGIALIGMMAIHILPQTDGNSEPTVTWTIFSGASAGLFALLAGVSLTFTSGGRHPVRGRALHAAQASLAVRAFIILCIGLLIAYLDPPAAIILAYYAVLFLLAIPLLGFGPKVLAGLALGFALLGPVVMQSVRDYLPDLDGYDPTFTTLVTDPTATISVLLISGSYPAIPWMAYICAGLALGRLDLRSHAIQVRITLGGLGLAVGAWLLSAVLLGPLGGRAALLQSIPGLDIDDIQRVQTFGPSDGLSTSSWWWLGILSPYSSTPLELLHTIGLGMAVLGGMLILGSRVASALLPLAAIGGMTLTLYSAHLVALSTRFLFDRPWLCLAVHVLVAILFAIIWRNVTAGKQGPLERVVSSGANAMRRKVLGRDGERADRSAADAPAPGSSIEADPLNLPGDRVETSPDDDARRSSR